MTATHDYTKRFWGHDYTIRRVIDSGASLLITGWGSGISDGDYLLLPNGAGQTRYQVESIKYKNDPGDMWIATVRFAPRSKE